MSMDSGSWTLYIFLLLLILGGGYFAAAETAFASVNRIRLQNKVEDGNQKAKTALYITEHFEEALSSILVGNNIMHIGTASLATLLAQRLWGAGAVALTTVVTTVVVFFVSEMLPKTLAGTHSDTLALALAPSLRFLMRLLYPVSIVFTKVSNAISRLFGSKPTPTVTEEELVDLIDNMESADPETEAQNQLLQSAMAFDRKTAQQVMTPYDQAEVLDEGLSPRDILQFCNGSRHSRVPVIRKGSTNVIGVLFLRDYIKVWTANREETRLRPLLRAPMLVPPDVPIDELLRTMSRRKVQLALVGQSLSAPMGLITAEDILEELVGDFGEAESL